MTDWRGSIVQFSVYSCRNKVLYKDEWFNQNGSRGKRLSTPKFKQKSKQNLTQARGIEQGQQNTGDTYQCQGRGNPSIYTNVTLDLQKRTFAKNRYATFPIVEITDPTPPAKNSN